ncbi:MAG TPA: patatin-like phospholipase family protein, partial [Thermoanaerobaculia bacterium]|nr:patatin-like phospholipase family protein [Thermoanaerobaculia bacterium]
MSTLDDRVAATKKGTPVEGMGQVVLVLQGGGALGAYQAGVFEALEEAGIEPDWIIGTSIGAINAGLIAGNAPEHRVPRLRDFWKRIAHRSPWQSGAAWPQLAQSLAFWNTITQGIPSFFEPSPFAAFGPHFPLGADRAGYYSTAPLERTLKELIDFRRLGLGSPRLTVGAAQVRSSKMVYFDSREMALRAEHIMASGALPPAFPPVRIDGDLYWDGGILSNTPSEVVFDDYPRRSSLIFAVHMWNPEGPEPTTIWEVLHRQKDIQYSSRVASHITRQLETHQLRQVIRELAALMPTEVREREDVRELASWGCLTRMHVVRLLAPSIGREDHTKDVDFSPVSIRQRWEAGRRAMQEALRQAPWRASPAQSHGVQLHDVG